MKNLNWRHITTVFLTIGFIIFSSCLFPPCSEVCITNNLEELLGKSFPYEDGDTVKFINSNSVYRKDTAHIYYSPPKLPDCKDQYPGRYDCFGSYTLRLGDFTIQYFQTDNWSGNMIIRFIGIDYYVYDLIDTVNYNFNNVELKAEYYKSRDTINLEKDYYDFYLSLDNKILEYTIRDNQVFETWRLLED